MTDDELIARLDAVGAAVNGVPEALRAARILVEENNVLRGKVADLTTKNVALWSRLGQAEAVIRATDQIVKNPGAGVVQTNYEDFLQPELRLAHHMATRGH